MKRTFLLILLSLGLAHGLKRLRHRRVSGPDPAVLGDTSFDRAQRQDQSSNLHKPTFTRCDEYEPEVFEEEPLGKKILIR